MTSKRQFSTDTVLVEFDGDLRKIVVAMDLLLKGRKRKFPDADNLWWDSGGAGDTYERLLNDLNELAPEGYFFGGHPYNPMIFGYWPVRISDVENS